MTRKKSDDAVSPVIGVMLMLVVVIIVAAVVTTFATGMTDNVEAAPIAKLDVEIFSSQEVDGAYMDGSGFTEYSSSSSVPSLHLTHVSGDPLDTADLKLTFSWYCETHDTRHSSSYQHDTTGKWGDANDKSGVAAFGCMEETGGLYGTSGYAGDYVQPLYINFGLENNAVNGAYFGSYVLKRGETMMAYDLHLTHDSHNGNPAMDALFNNGQVIAEYSKGVDLMPCTGKPFSKSKSKSITYNGKTVDNQRIPQYQQSYNFNIDKGMTPEEAENKAKNALGGDMRTCSELFGNTYDPVSQKCAVCGGSSTNCPRTTHFYSPDNTGKCSNCGYNPYSGSSGFTAGIMKCLPEGTAVTVVISHIPSSQVIYEEKVFVE